MNEATRRERSPRLLPLLFGLGLGAFALGIALLVFFTKFPVEWHEAKQRFRLWKAGARPLVWEKHRGFHLDRCGGAAARDCPCVWLIHGLGDSVSTWRRFFVDSSAFDGTPVHLFAIDLPAHGGSLRRKNPEEYRVSAMAAEIDAEIAKTTACERNLLVGNSFGGWVASSLALASPRRYERLILVSPGGVRKAEEETKNLLLDSSIESLKEFQRRAYYRPRELPDAAWKKVSERAATSSVGDVSKAQVDADRLDGRLRKIVVPTTLVWGEGDRILSRSVMDVFLAGIPGVKFVPLEKCGHLPQKECPETLFRVIRESLSETKHGP